MKDARLEIIENLDHMPRDPDPLSEDAHWVRTGEKRIREILLTHIMTNSAEFLKLDVDPCYYEHACSKLEKVPMHNDSIVTLWQAYKGLLHKHTALESECLDLIEEAECRAVDNDLGNRAYGHAIVRLKHYLKTGETSFFAKSRLSEYLDELVSLGTQYETSTDSQALNAHVDLLKGAVMQAFDDLRRKS
jgi:hypothetical protein